MIGADAEPIGDGESMMSDVWRVHLLYDVAGAGPGSVVAKVACQEPFRRAIANRFDFYRRELAFYGSLAALVAMRSPRCYAELFDPASGDFMLVLEDLSESRCITQADGASLLDALVAARALAELHAGWWGHTDDLPVPVVAIDAPAHIDRAVETFAHS